MAESVDPKELETLAELAHKFSYNPEHLRQLAATGRLHAWLISGTVWITTREHLKAYIKNRKPTGRPRGTGKHRKSRQSTER